MTRAALLLTDQLACLHLYRLAPTSSLLRARQLSTSRHHLTRAISNASSKRKPNSLPSYFHRQRLSRARPPLRNSRNRVPGIDRENEQFIASRIPLRSSWISLTLAGILSGLALFAIFPDDVGRSKLLRYLDPNRNPNMPAEIPPGRPETLTKEEEQKLRELWIATFKVGGISITEAGVKADDNSSIKTETKKRKMSLFRRVTGAKDDAEADGEEDKFGLASVYAEALKVMSPQEIRESIWGMVKIEDPDSVLLRFLRARKWDVQKALVMMIATMKWRQKDMGVDEEIMKNGELVNIDETEVISPTKKKLANDIMAQLVMGKSFLHGLDKEGRPMCFIRVRLHRPGAQSAESLERFTVYQIETTRLMMEPPVDTALICFDMTDFGLANLDYAPIKFIIKCFEANYPESLGVVLLHKAPWIFQGIWKIIRGWLDPVVAAKVHFTNSKEEMAEYIDIKRMSPELEGEEKWEYKYIEPQPGENDAMKDTATRDKIQAERNQIVDDYEKATIEWLKSTGEEATAANAKRTKLAADLKTSYWKLDPYIRARSFYDRIGVINPGGVINFYPSQPTATEKPAETPSEATNGATNGAATVPVAAVVAEKTETPNGITAADAPNGAPVETTA